MIDIEAVVANYLRAARAQDLPEPSDLRTATHPAPHKPPPLPSGWGAIYLFVLSDVFGSGCEAGPHRVLKVGRTSPNSLPRFTYQHYSYKAAGSTLAKSLLRHKVLWPFLGIANLNESTVGDWIRQNTYRLSIFIPAADYPLISPTLETFVRGTLGSVFEGSA